jgi:hypothetical protein
MPTPVLLFTPGSLAAFLMVAVFVAIMFGLVWWVSNYMKSHTTPTDRKPAADTDKD